MVIFADILIPHLLLLYGYICRYSYSSPTPVVWLYLQMFLFLTYSCCMVILQIFLFLTYSCCMVIFADILIPHLLLLYGYVCRYSYSSPTPVVWLYLLIFLFLTYSCCIVILQIFLFLTYSCCMVILQIFLFLTYSCCMVIFADILIPHLLLLYGYVCRYSYSSPTPVVWLYLQIFLE